LTQDGLWLGEKSWLKRAQAGTRFSPLLIGVFALVAALLASVGLYGVLATVVRQRTAEIGVRMTLGAGPGQIFNLIVGQGLRLTAIGVSAGLIVAFALTRTRGQDDHRSLREDARKDKGTSDVG